MYACVWRKDSERSCMRVSGDRKVSGHVYVSGDRKVSGHVCVCGDRIVSGHVCVCLDTGK
jgi:hypothetical protein